MQAVQTSLLVRPGDVTTESAEMIYTVKYITKYKVSKDRSYFGQFSQDSLEISTPLSEISLPVNCEPNPGFRPELAGAAKTGPGVRTVRGVH